MYLLHILFVSTALFFIGMYGLFTEKYDHHVDENRTDIE